MGLGGRPTTAALEYTAILAGGEPTWVIDKDMLNRFEHSGVFIADLTIPNCNVCDEPAFTIQPCKLTTFRLVPNGPSSGPNVHERSRDQ